MEREQRGEKLTSFTSTRRTHNEGQAFIHRPLDAVHLDQGKRDGVCFRDVLRIGPHIWKGVRYHVDFLFLEFLSVWGKHVRFRFSGGEDDGLPGKRIFELVKGDEGVVERNFGDGGCVLTFFGISVTQKNVSLSHVGT